MYLAHVSGFGFFFSGKEGGRGGGRKIAHPLFVPSYLRQKGGRSPEILQLLLAKYYYSKTSNYAVQDASENGCKKKEREGRGGGGM